MPIYAQRQNVHNGPDALAVNFQTNGFGLPQTGGKYAISCMGALAVKQYIWSVESCIGSMKMPVFRIRTKAVRDFHVFRRDIPENVETYLGRYGVWSTVDRARRFRSHEAAERALMEEWNRLRNAGNKSVMLSVVPDPG